MSQEPVKVPEKSTDLPARTRAKILSAALEWAEETGMRKLSMDEIAGRARLGRATLYIHFPGRKALIEAAVRAELDRFFATMQTEVDRYDDPEERVVRSFALAYRTLRSHRLLNAVMKLNPTPFIFGDRMAIDMGREFVLGTLRSTELNLDDRAANELAELVVRSFHSFVLAPSAVSDLDSPGAAEEYVRNFLVPLLHRAVRGVSSDQPVSLG